MGNLGKGMFLIIIGRKPMILRADEGLEEAPGLSGNLSQKYYLVGGEPCFTAIKGLADPPRYSGRNKPEDQNRQGSKR